jgi:hypothetical protein
VPFSQKCRDYSVLPPLLKRIRNRLLLTFGFDGHLRFIYLFFKSVFLIFFRFWDCLLPQLLADVETNFKYGAFAKVDDDGIFVCIAKFFYCIFDLIVI